MGVLATYSQQRQGKMHINMPYIHYFLRSVYLSMLGEDAYFMFTMQALIAN
jgi:hypothetical protein